MSSGVGTEPQFEHLTLSMLLGLKGITEIVKAAFDDGGSDQTGDVGALGYMLLGVISLGDRVETVMGRQDAPALPDDRAAGDEWIFR